MSNKQVDIFKALSHPTRRKILRKIAEKGVVSYKELTSIEPKAGVLYHHLRLLGDLIYQDENKLYKLTDKGLKVLEFMDSFLTEPIDLGIHKYFTPRGMIERIEGWKAYSIILACYFISLFPLLLSPNYIEFFIFLAPMKSSRFHPIIIAIISWLASSLLLRLLIQVIYQRAIPLLDLTVKLVPGFIIVNTSPLLIDLLTFNKIIESVIYTTTQIFSLLLVISAVSATAKISLRKSGIIVIALHYLGILTYLTLLLT